MTAKKATQDLVPRVSNKPFRDKFLACPTITTEQIAQATGWYKMDKARNGEPVRCADTSVIKRRLGLAESNGTIQKTITEADAHLLLDVFCFDPHEVGM